MSYDSAVEAYLDMMAHDRAGKPYVKKQYYEKLAGKFNRTAKAFEYRMQNISYVLSLMGRDWLRGLKPAMSARKWLDKSSNYLRKPKGGRECPSLRLKLLFGMR